jgi:peptide/nickel transport system substrate-binding protein
VANRGIGRRELIVGAMSSLVVGGCAAPGALRPGQRTTTTRPAGAPVTTVATPTGQLLRQRQVMRLAIDQPSTAGPGPGFDTGLSFVTNLCFNSLWGFDAQRQLIPADAVTYKPSADLRTHVFTLRPNLTWSDGTPLTAQGYEWSWKTQATRAGLTPDSAIAGAAALAAGIGDAQELGVRALDDVTLEVRTSEPCPYLLDMVAGRVWSRPVPRHVVEAHGDEWAQLPHWAGNGPFSLVSWERNSSMVLERRNDFVGGPLPTLERIELIIVDDPVGETAYRAFEAGQLDYAVVPLPEADRVRTTAKPGQLAEVSFPYLSMIVLNAAMKPFDDVRVRQALYLALDRDELVQLTRGLGVPAYSLLAPEMREGYPGTRRPAFAAVDNRVQRAKELMSEAGYPDGKGFPRIEYLALAASGTAGVEAVAAQWRAVLGIDIAIRPLDVAAWAGAVFSADTAGWGMATDAAWPSDFPDPSDILGPLLAFGGLIYHHNVGLPEELLVSLRDGLSASTGRGEMLAQFDLAVMEQVPVIPLAFGVQLSIRQPGVETEFFYYGSDFQRLRFAQLREVS